MSTDGRLLFSYSLLIARYGYSDDRPVVFNYTVDGGNFISATTSKQVRQTVNWLREEGREVDLILPETEGVPYV